MTELNHPWDLYGEDERIRVAQIAIRANNKRVGLIRPETVEIYVKLLTTLRAWDGDGRNARKHAAALRSLGDPLDVETRKKLGLSSRLIVGREFFDSLTEKARKDPREASEAIAYWPCHAVNGFLRLALCLNDRCLATPRVDHRVCCPVARPLADALISVPLAKIFPQEGCDHWRCTCSYDRSMVIDPAIEFIPASTRLRVDDM